VLNFADLLYRRTLAVFGVPAILTLPPVGEDDPVTATVTAIDRTAGVEVTDGSIGVQTIRPAVDVRRADLDAAGVALAALDGATLQVNGASWQVAGIMEKPTPFGATDGLVTLWLVGNA
jgi:hypothetical protein